MHRTDRPTAMPQEEDEEPAAKATRHHVETKRDENVDIISVVQEAVVAVVDVDDDEEEESDESVAFMPLHNDYSEETN